MECTNYDDYQKLAVRISNSENKLLGSGILYIRNIGESPLILTAAHIFPKEDETDLILQYFHSKKDRRTEGKFVRREDAGELQDYEFVRQDQAMPTNQEDELVDCDLGIIRVPWQDWMKELPAYAFAEAKSKDPLFIWGFPAFGEEEGIAGLSALKDAEADVNNQGTTTVSYDSIQEGGTATREKATEGFSGSGAFTENAGGLVLAGVVSRSFGKKAAGDRLKIENSWKFLPLFRKYQIEQGFPVSLEPYIQKNLDSFSEDKQDAKDFFEAGLQNLVNPDMGALTPASFWKPEECERFENLPCSGSRKSCPVYWAGQLAKAYCFCEVPDKDLCNLKKLTFTKENSDNTEEEIHIEFLCTEQNWEQCITDFVKKKYFQGPDGLDDHTIYLWNSEKTKQYGEIFKKSKCQALFQNITKGQGKYLEGLTGGKFSITKGSLPSCNMAVIGMGRLKQNVISDSDGDSDDMLDNLNLLVSQAWK